MTGFNLCVHFIQRGLRDPNGKKAKREDVACCENCDLWSAQPIMPYFYVLERYEEIICMEISTEYDYCDHIILRKKIF